MGRIGEVAWGVASLTCGYWTHGQLRAYQARRLRYLVRHCYDEVPLYRQRFDQAFVTPTDFAGPEDLARLPVLTRADLQSAHPSEVIARSRAGSSMRTNRTSGSSGAPLEIRKTPFEYWLMMAFRLKRQFHDGLLPWHRRFDVSRIRKTPETHWWNRLGLLRREVVDCLEPLPQILEKLRAARPHRVGGYSGMVAAVAAAMTEQDRASLRPLGVSCGGETVTPAMRATIEEAFGTRLLVSYGAHEFNQIAEECRLTGLMHLNSGNVFAEVVREGKPVPDGETGEILLTGLHNHAMPFLRYALGDIVRQGPDPCPCGAPFPTLREIQGRIVEMLKLPDGTRLHPYALVQSLTHEAPWVKHYQLIQERRDFIRVRLAILTPQSRETLDHTRLRLEDACGGGVQVELEIVDEIRPEESGKFRPYYSLVED